MIVVDRLDLLLLLVLNGSDVLLVLASKNLEVPLIAHLKFVNLKEKEGPLRLNRPAKFLSTYFMQNIVCFSTYQTKALLSFLIIHIVCNFLCHQ